MQALNTFTASMKSEAIDCMGTSDYPTPLPPYSRHFKVPRSDQARTDGVSSTFEPRTHANYRFFSDTSQVTNEGHTKMNVMHTSY